MVCIVSAYYKIPSKFPHSKYLPHLIRWFKSVGTRPNVHFFTSEDVFDELQKHVNTTGVTFHFLPFSEITANDLGRNFWQRQYDRDPERYHTPELGMIWYEKRHFVRRAMEIDDSSTFIWCDAGCVRDEISESKAREFGTRGLGIDDNKIHLQIVSELVPKDFYQFPDVSIAGAIIAGNRSAWTTFIKHYEASLHEYDEQGVSGISDQYVTSQCVTKYKKDYVLHRETTQVDTWFQLLEIL